MGQISLQIPQSGQPNSTEDAKIASDFTTLQTVINGGLDPTNFSATTWWTTYTPAWTAATLAPTLGNGTLTGSYVNVGKLCLFRIMLVTGSSTFGGQGGIAFSLPVQAAAGFEQDVPCKLYANANATNWAGFGVIASAATTVSPLFPGSSSQSNVSNCQNADGTGAASTGIPLISGGFPLVNGSNIVISGTYQTA